MIFFMFLSVWIHSPLLFIQQTLPEARPQVGGGGLDEVSDLEGLTFCSGRRQTHD